MPPVGKRQTRKHRNGKPKKSPHPPDHFCSIPVTPPHVLSSSSPRWNQRAANFYEWVNGDWLAKTKIPPFENDFGVSEEVERCIYEVAKDSVLKTKEGPLGTLLQNLSDSALHSAVQHVSVETLESVLEDVRCARTLDDVVRQFARLAKRRFSSLLGIEYTIDSRKRVGISLDGTIPGLPIGMWSDLPKIEEYSKTLAQLGDLFQLPDLPSILRLEEKLVKDNEAMWTDMKRTLKGSRLLRKFPLFPWKVWFKELEISDWTMMDFSYYSPKWIRHISKLLHILPVSIWKLYIARCWILNSIPYLPPPFDEIDFAFFGRTVQGQKQKMPQLELLVRAVYDYLPDEFSRLFWESTGAAGAMVAAETPDFAATLVDAAVSRLREVDWLGQKTRVAAIEKVKAMRIEIARPLEFIPTGVPLPALDNRDFLGNIFLLGEYDTKVLLRRVGGPYNFWEEGLYRVNAFYFNENNEIMIPYGTIIPPFYTVGPDASVAQNYGALGCIIGHEMCHAFDEYGKEFGPDGVKKKWWSRRDNRHFQQKAQALVRLFESQEIFGKYVDGRRTLSENIADLGGVAIALEALKASQQARGIYDSAGQKKEFRDFFIAFAVSWRTKYREEKLKTSIYTDRHAPAHLRVNLVVSQFQEWYDAFDIDENDPVWMPPEKRIRIF